MDKVDCVVVGAGVIGLAVARALARLGREVIVIESHPMVGMETSSRNSEVIHAGLYYPSGSLKAQLCLSGRDALYAYCREKGIAHQHCGKLIVATSNDQRDALTAILEQAHANGCTEVRALSAQEAQALEPALSCTAALHSPNTGIIDSHGCMLALHGDAEHAGAVFAFNSKVVSGNIADEGIELLVQSSDDNETMLHAHTLINCAGLFAPQLAAAIAGLEHASIPSPYFAKGSYYSLNSRAPFSRLIYPVPEAGGLGVHLTLDLGGQARFGPDVEWLDDGRIDYHVDPRRADGFYRDIRRYWPDLPDASLQPAYAGIRPKIAPSQSGFSDFLFASHGCHHYLGLYGIESPGLTACLAIGDHVASLICGETEPGRESCARRGMTT